MEFPNAKLVIFAKPPVSGQCKTRLIPTLGEQGATELHRRMMHRTLTMATQSQLATVELWCADNITHPFIQHCAHQYGVAIKLQHGSDLGARMQHALKTSLAAANSALIIGTDCPSLNQADLRAALQALEEGYVCAIHPAHDGGYVSIGVTQVNGSLFSNIHWGSPDVYRQTQQRIAALGWPYKELATHYDIDTPDDLIHLKDDNLSTFCSPY